MYQALYLTECKTSQEGDMKADSGKIGPVIFIGTLILVLIFFWWFLFYSHGVKPGH